MFLSGLSDDLEYQPLFIHPLCRPCGEAGDIARGVKPYLPVWSSVGPSGARRPGNSVGRSASNAGNGHTPGGLWSLEFGSAAVTAIPIPSTSLTGSTARPTGCSAPNSRTGRLLEVHGPLPFCRRVASTACTGGGAAQPATCSPEKSWAAALSKGNTRPARSSAKIRSDNFLQRPPPPGTGLKGNPIKQLRFGNCRGEWHRDRVRARPCEYSGRRHRAAYGFGRYWQCRLTSS
jgi:hypothetical protein